jgi:hypothetical protein
MSRHKIPRLLLVAAVLAASAGAQAQTIPSDALDCGPGRVNVGDHVALNVGNPGSAADPTVVSLTLFDGDGGVLVERTLTLAAGQSQTLRWRVAAPKGTRQVLVRGEIVRTGGFDEPRLRGTMQVFGRGGLTYGPNFECSGLPGGRGPV